MLRLTQILFVALCASLATPVTTAAETPPNVVLILSDDQAWTDYSFMGHDIVQTPSLDKLANEGVTFKRGYVPTSLCRPSLATIATGLYASQHGITGNDPSRELPGGKGGALYKQQRAEIISKVETYVVIVKIGILLLIIVPGFGSVDIARLEPDTWEPFLQIASAGMIIFVAYEGFELIANAASDVKNYKKTHIDL